MLFSRFESWPEQDKIRVGDEAGNNFVLLFLLGQCPILRPLRLGDV